MSAWIPRTRAARWEAGVLVLLAVLFLAGLIPATTYARREYRDGVRRTLVREVKNELEQWFNAYESFPIHPSGDAAWCGSTDDPDDWFFVHILIQERRKPAISPPGRDRAFPLRYCPTAAGVGRDGRPAASAFYLEAVLEHRQPEGIRWNFEYNIAERSLTIDGRPLYRVCGGEETQCGLPPAGS